MILISCSSGKIILKLKKLKLEVNKMDYDKILEERKVPKKLIKDILQDQELEIFDVARWCKDDIRSVMEKKDIKIKNEDLFISQVIQEIDAMFDPSVGINWEVIDVAVDTVHSVIES